MRVIIKVGKDCTLCGLCARYCPTNVYRIGVKGLEFDETKCIYCRGCEVLCPVNAIELKLLDEDLTISIHRALNTG